MLTILYFSCTIFKSVFLHVLSCSVLLKSVLLISCVFRTPIQSFEVIVRTTSNKCQHNGVSYLPDVNADVKVSSFEIPATVTLTLHQIQRKRYENAELSRLGEVIIIQSANRTHLKLNSPKEKTNKPAVTLLSHLETPITNSISLVIVQRITGESYTII